MRLIAALVLFTSFVQEEKPKEDGKPALIKAIEETVAAGGFTFDGEVTKIADVAVMGAGFGAPPDLTGKFSGTVAADGAVVVKLAAPNGTFELFRQGGKTARRFTWSGKAVPTDDFVAHVSAFLDCTALAAQVKRLRNVKPAEAGAYELKFQPDYVEGEKKEPEAPGVMAGFDFDMFELDHVDAKVTVSADSGRVTKLEMTVVQTLNEDMMGGGAPEIDSKLKYLINILGSGKDLKVEIPEDVKRILK